MFQALGILGLKFFPLTGILARWYLNSFDFLKSSGADIERAMGCLLFPVETSARY